LKHVLRPIAIVGMAFRFPGGCNDEQSLWAALRDGRDLISQVPAERWATDELQHARRSEPGRSITFTAGVLPDIDGFDADFFGISPREAAWLDPQQRLLLELSWEALENAGVLPSSLAGSDCAVYVGISSLDYGTRGLDDLASLSAHTMTGNTLSIAANRLSYFYDLHGPSLAVDTACSSSLVALHHACRALQTGEATTALVGGVNLLLHPYPFVGFTKASMLSATGRCRAFDADGDGYVRSEGGAVLLLKPYERALAEGDDIQAVILASGVNTDGARKTGITIPSSEAQAELMRQVLSRCGLAAGDVDFIEAHGTGTAVGDPVEARAIGLVYGQERDTPLPVGSVKANLGHLEAASGMAGLVKAVLALKNRALPMALHLQAPNPQIDFQGLNLTLCRKYTDLPTPSGRPLIAGVNSFGFGGANAHVLLQAHVPNTARSSAQAGAIDPIPDSAIGQDPTQPVLPPLFLSAHTHAALRDLARCYATHLESATQADYRTLVQAAAWRRARLQKRLVLHADTPETAVGQLQRFAENGAAPQVYLEDALPQGGGVAFVYSGNGSQWLGMGRALQRESPRFASLLSELDEVMQPHAGFSLLDALNTAQTDSRLDDTTVAQPLLFAIQVAITRLLEEAGIKPDAVTGHSVGEVAAAWAAGALDLEQSILVICTRSQVQAKTRGSGCMAAAGMSARTVAEVLAELAKESAEMEGIDPPRVELAGFNSPENVTLTGDRETLLRIQDRVRSKGMFFRILDLDYAFHSRHMAPMEEELVVRLAGLTPTAACKAHFVSSVTGEVHSGDTLDARYWWRNVREPVRFTEAVNRMAALGCRIFVEIGPHAILQRYIGECLAAADIQARVMPTLVRNDDGVQRFQETILRIQLLGDLRERDAWFPQTLPWVRLPNYPWQRERHWHPRTSESLLAIDRRRVHPLLGWRLPDGEFTWENILDTGVLPWLADHQVGGAMLFPGAAYAEMALAAAREWLGETHFVVADLDIVTPMVLAPEQGRSLRLLLNPRDGGFQIKSRQRLSHDEWTLHATGRLLEPTQTRAIPRIEAVTAPTKVLTGEIHYRLAASIGLGYGPAFQGLREARLGQGSLEVSLQVPEGLQTRTYLLHPALLDVCFQSLVDFFAKDIEAGQGIALLPVRTGRLEHWGGGEVVRLRARLGHRGARSVLADFELLDGSGTLVARLEGCRFRAAVLKRSDSGRISNWRIVPWLQPHPGEEGHWPSTGLENLAVCARGRLAEITGQRHLWFKETLPLIEALALSFAYEACRLLAQQRPADWQHSLRTSYGRWLVNLLVQEGLLQISQDRWSVVEDVDLPAAATLWQSLLRDSPACLPHLTLMGRVGRQLPALLCGELDGQALARELRQSPVAEVLYDTAPGFLGMRVVLEERLNSLAEAWPATRRLRVLEIAAGASELPKTLMAALPEDRLDYVLAVSDEALQSRLQAEYQDHVNAVVASLTAQDWMLSTSERLPPAFDIVILQHSLHRTNVPQAALQQVWRWLVPDGLLLLVERHPDWSADFLEGIDPDWWRVQPNSAEAPVSSLLQPQAWQRILMEAGFSDCELFLEPAAEGLPEGAYLLQARRGADHAEELPAPAVASWLLLVDEASRPLADRLRRRLESMAQQVALAEQLVMSKPFAHVVYLLGWQDDVERVRATLVRLLQDVQALTGPRDDPPRLWLVTRGGALASDLPGGVATNPAQTAIWGFARVVMNECPQLACTLIDLACDPMTLDTLARLENELLRPDGANEVVLSTQARHCLVLREEAAASPQIAPQDSRFRLDFHMPGQLRNLQWLPAAERPLGDEEIEVHTRATGLNFRDVMYVMGLLPDEAVENGFAGASLGLEFSGVVSRVGARVRDLMPGDAVMGFGTACFASHVVTRANAMAPVPVGWGFESAATVPTAFFTVYYALKHLADLQPGERVLIHGAAGGVGMAAIQLARHLGAEIFATAGSEEKRDFVTLLGADHVFDSRSLAFADDIRDATGGEGVDVVLNSLAGEAMRRGLDVLKPFGRFLELGKRDFFENTPLGLRPFRHNISYFGIDADQLLTERPGQAARLFREVMALFREEVLTPLPHRGFAAEHIVDAFRVMQQARHIGKIVVNMMGSRPPLRVPVEVPRPLRFEQDSTWIVTGGLSGFGLASARWLADRGVGNLVLVGRRGPSTPGAQEVLETLAAQGVEAHALACDITDARAVKALVERVRQTLPPLRGVLHAAAVFDDRLLANLDAAGIERVLDAKLLGAWHLHQATLDIPLGHFVLYSSVTTVLGNPGQANYVAANAGLEGLVSLRRQLGLPATAIAWGPIADAGYLLRNRAVKDSLEQRLGKPPMGMAEALAELDRALVHGTGLYIPANFDWNVLARLLPSASGVRFGHLNRHRQSLPQTGESLDIRALIADRPPAEVSGIVCGLVIQEVAQILCIAPERIEPNRSLHDLGMDSLMAVELALGLEQRFGLQLPAMMLSEAPTVERVAARIVEKLCGEDPEEAEKRAATELISGIARQHGETLSQDEIELLSTSAHRHAKTGTGIVP